MSSILVLGSLFFAVNGADLPSLWITDTSVSGLSSGAFMAAQYEVIFSSEVTGAAIIAGGMWGCTEGSIVHVPRCGVTPNVPFDKIDDAVPELVKMAKSYSSKGDIDALSNVANHKIYMFSGNRDFTIDTDVMKATKKAYLGYGTPEANIKTHFGSSAGHAWPRDNFGNVCGLSAPPFIQNCHEDIPKVILEWTLNTQLTNARGTYKSNNLVKFAQGKYVQTNSHFASDGYAYIPDDCKNAANACRLHIAFHGCWQSAGSLGTGSDFIKNSGLNEWAETNRIVVLYPQATFTLSNPLSCWDYIASTGDSFLTHKSKQSSGVRAMVKKLKSGKPDSTPPIASPDIAPSSATLDIDGGITPPSASPDFAPPSTSAGIPPADISSTGKGGAAFLHDDDVTFGSVVRPSMMAAVVVVLLALF